MKDFKMLLRNVNHEEDEGFQDVVKECEPMVIEMFRNACS